MVNIYILCIIIILLLIFREIKYKILDGDNKKDINIVNRLNMI